MCKVIAVVNQKGGVSKTTTVVNLSVGLAKKDKKVLVVDADPQGSLSASLGYREPDDLKETLGTVLGGIIRDEEYDWQKIGIRHHEEGIDVLPGNIELAALEVSLVNVMSRELMLRQYMDQIKDYYDYVLIDCMPSLGMLTINALACADSVLIPVQASYLPVKGLEQLLMTISKVRRQMNRKLGIEGILISMTNHRTNYAKDIISLIHQVYGDKVRIFDNCIPFSVRAEEASAEGISIYKHDPKGKVAEAYQLLTEEVLANEE